MAVPAKRANHNSDEVIIFFKSKYCTGICCAYMQIAIINTGKEIKWVVVGTVPPWPDQNVASNSGKWQNKLRVLVTKSRTQAIVPGLCESAHQNERQDDEWSDHSC